jgi:hypothetical protein
MVTKSLRRATSEPTSPLANPSASKRHIVIGSREDARKRHRAAFSGPTESFEAAYDREPCNGIH